MAKVAKAQTITGVGTVEVRAPSTRGHYDSVGAHGGIVLAQDEETSKQFTMPASAIETGCVDRVLPITARRSRVRSNAFGYYVKYRQVGLARIHIRR